MLLNATAIQGLTVAGRDGAIGTICGVLFDDVSWTVRWLVVDTGTWLTGRKVLLPPSALGHPDPETRSFPVRLTRAAVEASPEQGAHLPVSRQVETEIYDHYGWSPYWGSGYYPGGYGMLAGGYTIGSDPESLSATDDIARQAVHADDPHLRSAEAVTGCHIEAMDGTIGHVVDLLVDDTDWSIHHLVVDTSNWWNGSLVLIPPGSVKDIEWTDRLIYLDVNRATVMAAPVYDPTKPFERSQEKRIAQHYVQPVAPDEPAAEPQEAG